MDTIKYQGELEIDTHRGVIYFHSNEGITILRICRVPMPTTFIPKRGDVVDITLGVGVNWIQGD